MSDTRSLVLRQASTIRTKRQRFLWTGRIPLGTVTIFAGRGGEGKSTFALHIAALANRGQLEGDLHGKSVPALIISHEDDWGTVMKPRLLAAGADTALVYQVSVSMTVDAITMEMVPKLPIDVELIRQAVIETGAKIIIIDPITSTIGGDLHKVAEVRAALDPISQLAQELDVAIIAIAHFSKGSGNVSDKVSGSHAFRDVARSVLLFATDEESGQRIVSVDKSNYSADRGTSFAFNLVSVDIATDDGNTTSAAHVDYLGDSDVSVSDIVNRTPDGDEDDRSEAERWLIGFLEDSGGAAKAEDVRKASTRDGFEWRTMQRASKKIVEKSKSGFQGHWRWMLDFTKDDTKASKASGIQTPVAFGAIGAPLGGEVVNGPWSMESTS